MPYIYVGSGNGVCSGCEYKPIKRPTNQHPLGSVWECPECETQWEKSKSSDDRYGWYQLPPDEMLIYNEETGQHTKPEDCGVDE